MTYEEQIYAQKQLESLDERKAEIKKKIKAEKGKLERLQEKIENAKQKMEEL